MKRCYQYRECKCQPEIACEVRRVGATVICVAAPTQASFHLSFPTSFRPVTTLLICANSPAHHRFDLTSASSYIIPDTSLLPKGIVLQPFSELSALR